MSSFRADLLSELVGYDLSTAEQQGWSSIRNGDLLELAPDRGFEVFLTRIPSKMPAWCPADAFR